MNIAIPILDTNIHSNNIAASLNVNGSLCLYDTASDLYKCMKINELADNMGDLLPALEAIAISVIITRQIHPMALKVLVNKGFEVYKAKGDVLDENIQYYKEQKLDLYSYETAMELATVCGGECTSCDTSVCDDEKKNG